ncbi:MAG: hypothetical protein AB1609_05900 [Bacillota bacterium]
METLKGRRAAVAHDALDKDTIRQIIAEEVRRHLAAKGGDRGRSGVWVMRPVPLVQGIAPVERQAPSVPAGQSSDVLMTPAAMGMAGQESKLAVPGQAVAQQPQGQQQGNRQAQQQQLNRIAHVLANTQVQISRILEGSLRDLHELVIRAEVTAEKVRSILRRTEPTREANRPGGP